MHSAADSAEGEHSTRDRDGQRVQFVTTGDVVQAGSAYAGEGGSAVVRAIASRALPVNRVEVDSATFDRLNRIAHRFQNGQIPEWEMAGQCRAIDPRLKLFHFNELVVRVPEAIPDNPGYFKS